MPYKKMNPKHLLAMLAFFGMLLATAVHLVGATFSPTGYRVRPTRNDVASTALEGRMFNEGDLVRERSQYGQRNFVSVGLSPTVAASTNLYLTISAGTAFINGYFAQVTTTTLISATAATTNYAFLELPTSSNLVTSVRYTVNTSGTNPSTHSFLLCSFTASATSITAAVDMRGLTPFSSVPPYTIFTSSGTYRVPDSVTVLKLTLVGGGGGGGGASGAGGTGSNSTAFTYTATGGNGGASSAGGGGGASGIDGSVAANGIRHGGQSGQSNTGGLGGGGTFLFPKYNNLATAPANTGVGGMGGSGGGGGGGETIQYYVTVTAGTGYAIVIGNGGTAGSGATVGRAGAAGLAIIEY